jgi:sigma-54-specific transcriptional regulator
VKHPFHTTATFELRGPVGPYRARALIFRDPASLALLEEVERVAPTDVTVLLRGETGTGKELIARYLHERSARRDGPFVAVNCGALSHALLESELFGHERGAFTGALTSRAGFIEAASGGTLFLDEIGELPGPAQVHLLRVLQEREVTRVGSRVPTSVDVRVVAATHRNLGMEVAHDRFRRDLFYRLAVVSLYLAPLRERRGDIVPLARNFLQLHAQRLGLGALRLSEAAEAELASRAWPGNIRELENVVVRAILRREGTVVGLDALAGEERFDPVPPAAERAPTPSDGPGLERAIECLAEADRSDLLEIVEGTLYRTLYRRSDGNQLQIARTLGVSRDVVRARLMKYDLLAPRRRVRHGAVEQTRDDP